MGSHLFNNSDASRRKPRSLCLFGKALVVAAVSTALALLLRKIVRQDLSLWLLPAVALLTSLATALWAVRCRERVLSSDARYKDVLDSVGTALMVIEPDGNIAYMNPATERLLGYHASELTTLGLPRELLAPGEADHLVHEMERHCGFSPSSATGNQTMLAAYLHCVQTLPPSQVPSFQLQLQRKDGSTRLATLHVSAFEAGGAQRGLIAVAIDESSTLRREQQLRETQESYRDLFESASEMIAMLSPTGRFLYVNPAWKACFGLDDAALLALDSFEQLFAPGYSNDAVRFFRAALEGKTVDREPVCHHTPDGRVLNVELSFSLRQKAGKPIAVRCLLRDVTQQKQREHRLALQLAIGQIIGENDAPLSTARRILEALSLAQNWDLVVLWKIEPGNQRLEFGAAWSATEPFAEALLQESMGVGFAPGEELVGQVWQNGHTRWIAELATVPQTSRLAIAQSRQMRSAWAVPVRADKRVLAVLEFYSRFALGEDREALASIEMAATSLGQMLARSEEQGRALEMARRQEVLLDAVAEGICGLDRNGVVRFANPAATSLLAAPATRLIGSSLHDLLHGSAPADCSCDEDCPLRAAVTCHKVSSSETTIFRADGDAFPAEFTLTPLLEQGRFSGSVLSFRDVSQRNALDRLKDEFISTVSHELRTPLTSIRGALGLLSSGMLGPLGVKPANLLRIALNNSERLVRLINDILDLERIQSGREPLAFRSMQLNDVVRQAVDGITPMAENAGVKLIHDATQVELIADPDRLLQVLTNLLSNAVKFSPEGATVSVILHPGSEGVTLSVIDHGRGIPADKLESVFGRFQQVDASDARQKGGSGLGLAICRTIVVQHSGRIWAERNPVRGTTFRVYLPYQPSPQESLEDLTAPEPGHGSILLAGAGDAIRPRIVALLVRHGYRVVEAATVEHALEAARNKVEAIVLDTSLDGMNGWKILPQLRKLDPAAATPIVLLAVDEPSAAPDSADGLLCGPLDERALLHELARVLCGHGEQARILIVEDDRELAEVIAQVFSCANIAVERAHSLDEALKACENFRPHLLVLDLGLPDGNGFNVVDWLRQHESLAHLPLVVYSGRTVPPSERAQLTLGPTHFLTKTRVEPQQLEALVLTMLRSTMRPEETVNSAQ
jgi:PAS domain S-box-containing protein